MTRRRRLRRCVQVLACSALVALDASQAGAQRILPTVGARHTSLPLTVSPQPRPALEPLRISGEVLAGNLAGIGGYFLGNALGHHIASRWPDQSETTRYFISDGMAYTGAAFATAGGVYAVGTIGDQTGSFSATLLGTGVGAGVAWVLDRTFLADDNSPSASASQTRWTQALVKSLLPSIGATIGFNSSRRFR